MKQLNTYRKLSTFELAYMIIVCIVGAGYLIACVLRW